MQAFVAVLIHALSAAMGYLVGRVMIALGITVLSFVGITELTELIWTQIDDMWVQAEGVEGFGKFVQFLGLLQFDLCLDLLVAAWIGRFSFLGMAAGGSITRLVNRFEAAE